MSRPIIHITSISRTGIETCTDDIPSRTREETKGLYEMISAMTSEIKSMNRQHDEDREEFRIFRKEYEIDREKRKFDHTSFRKDIRSLADC